MAPPPLPPLLLLRCMEAEAGRGRPPPPPVDEVGRASYRDVDEVGRVWASYRDVRMGHSLLQSNEKGLGLRGV